MKTKEFIAECLNCGERFNPLKYFGCPTCNYPCANIVGEKIVEGANE